MQTIRWFGVVRGHERIQFTVGGILASIKADTVISLVTITQKTLNTK